jgi:hypothetical protein
MRHCWQIGMIEFCAKKDGTGWFVTAMIGQSEIMEEVYRDGPLERIMDWSAHYVMGVVCRELHDEACNFNPSDYL